MAVGSGHVRREAALPAALPAARHVPQQQDGRVTGQHGQGRQGDVPDLQREIGLRLAPGGQAEQGHRAIAQRDPLQDAHDADMGDIEMRQQVEDQAEREQGHDADHDVAGQGGLRLAGGAGSERERHRRPDAEQEAGEDHVGQGQAVPVGVVEDGEIMHPVALVGDQDHADDAQPPQDIDGVDARRRRLFRLGFVAFLEFQNLCRHEPLPVYPDVFSQKPRPTKL